MGIVHRSDVTHVYLEYNSSCITTKSSCNTISALLDVLFRRRFSPT